jgi:DNA polymerase-4
MSSSILHVDADAFFASVEIALNPKLRGKPVAVTNSHLGNRAIILTASYEARKFGVKTGILFVDAKRLCPELVFTPISMHNYGLYSLRIAEILRRFSPVVEEASIDEWYIDLAGLRRLHHASYATIAERIQKTVEQELNITVSCGIASSKILAKMASDFRKPKGVTVVREREREAFLRHNPLADVPGFGPSTQALLQKLGCRTALDAVLLGEGRMKGLLGKRGVDMWNELSGKSMGEIVATPARRKSISHQRTFIKVVTGEELFAEVELLLLESAAKLRKLKLAAKEFWLALREVDYRSSGSKVRFNPPTANEACFIEALEKLFKENYHNGHRYRAAHIGFAGLVEHRPTQLSLLDPRENKTISMLPALDALNDAYGRGTVTRAAALPANPKAQAFVGRRIKRKGALPIIGQENVL